MKKVSLFLFIAILFSACAPATQPPALPAETTVPAQPTSTQVPVADALWVSPAVPDTLRDAAKHSGLPLVDSADIATQKLDIADSGSLWIYALVAPFPTVTDNLPSADLISAWQNGSSLTGNGQPLLMAESTLRAFTALWGEP